MFMSWADALCGIFDDLEQQAEGLHLAERDADVADRSVGEYAKVNMASRLHASVGAPLTMTVSGVGRLHGILVRVGLDWCLLRGETAGQEWIVRLAALTDVRGASGRAVTEPARTVLTRLALGSALRGVVDSGTTTTLLLVDGAAARGSLLRVGADFVEICEDGSEDLARGRGRPTVLHPFTALAAVRRP